VTPVGEALKGNPNKNALRHLGCVGVDGYLWIYKHTTLFIDYQPAHLSLPARIQKDEGNRCLASRCKRLFLPQLLPKYLPNDTKCIMNSTNVRRRPLEPPESDNDPAVLRLGNYHDPPERHRRIQRDPSVVNQPTEPRIELSDRQLALLKQRQQQPTTRNSLSSDASQNGTETSVGDPQTHQRAFLRSLLTKQQPKKKKNGISAAKQNLLLNVLKKSQSTSHKPQEVVQSSSSSTASSTVSSAMERWKKRPKPASTAPKDTPTKTMVRQRYEESLRRKTKVDEFERGYATFFVNLSEEVMGGQHSQLWESFSAILQNRPMQLSVPPKKKSLKFDPATKQLVLQLNQYLLDSAVEGNHVAATQLTNDKRFREEAAAGQAVTGRIALKKPLRKRRASHASNASSSVFSSVDEAPSMTTLDISQPLHLANPVLPSPSVPPSPSLAISVPPSPSITGIVAPSPSVAGIVAPSPSVAGIVPPPTPPPLPSPVASVVSSVTQRDRYGAQESRYVPLKPDQIMENRSGSPETVPPAPDLTLHRSMKPLTDDLSPSTRTRTSYFEESSHFDETTSNAGLEITLGQYEANATASTPREWRSIQLRSVPEEEKSTTSSSSSPEFASLRLRSIPKSPSNDDSAPSDEQDSIISTVSSRHSVGSSSSRQSASRLSVGSVPSRRRHSVESTRLSNSLSVASSSQSATIASSHQETSVVDSTKSQDNTETTNGDSFSPVSASSSEPAPSDETAASASDELTKNSMIISATSSESSGGVRVLEDEALTISLLSDDEPQTVTVGRHMITKVRIQENGERSVIWNVARSHAQSLTLDMATQRVSILLVEGKKKQLSFATSEDCLSFANHFYQSPPASDDEAIEEKGLSSGDDDDEDNDLLKVLNDEEQRVLETYRRLRKTKHADDALQESVTQHSDDGKDKLTPEEEKIADKYRGMLRMSFSLAVVKVKMSEDKVSERIVSAITAEAKVIPPEFVDTPDIPSSPISTFSSSCAFPESQMVDSYKAMLAHESPNSVREKMKRDHAGPKIINLVFSDDSTTATNLTDAEEESAAVYRRMLKMSFPEEAVRHKMKREEVSQRIVDAIFPPSAVKEEPKKKESTSSDLSSAESEIAQKYKRMLGMGIPPDAVRHKMKRDEIDAKIVGAVLSGEESAPQTSEAKPPIVLPKPKKRASLSNEEESVASQFRKLLKLQIPKQKVLARMQQEGVHEKIITAVLGKVHGLNNESTSGDGGSSGKGSNLVSLHWTPLSGKALDESVWSLAGKNRSSDSVDSHSVPETSDISELISLFQKKDKGAVKKRRQDEDTSGKAKLLDLTRSNNIAISLKAFKDFSFKELADIIEFVDPLRQVLGERAQLVKDLLPTIAESSAIKEYSGDHSRLVPAELWFQYIVNIKRIDAKASALRTMEMFNSEAKMLSESFDLLTTVCEQVMRSGRLQELLEMVLHIGNIMNEGTRTGGAAGFKFDSLLRLTQTKSFDGKTTVLDFIVNLFVSKKRRQALKVSEDFPECHKASRIVVSDLLKEVKEIGESLDLCKNELEAMIADVTPKKTLKMPPKPETTSDPRASLLSAIQSRQTGTEESFPQANNVLARARALEEQKEPTPPVLVANKSSIQGGIDRLQKFIAIETETYADLLNRRDKALQACRDTAKYCGESGGVGAIAPLLSVLAQFAANIDEAIKKYDHKQKSLNRSQRDNGFKDTVSCNESTMSAATNGTEAKEAKKSLVLMVNEMLKKANDRTKEDFKKGRVYEYPSKGLRAIYEREQTELITAKAVSGTMTSEDIEKAKANFAGVSSPQKLPAPVPETPKDISNPPMLRRWSTVDHSIKSQSGSTALETEPTSLTGSRFIAEESGNARTEETFNTPRKTSVADAVKKFDNVGTPTKLMLRPSPSKHVRLSLTPKLPVPEQRQVAEDKSRLRQSTEVSNQQSVDRSVSQPLTKQASNKETESPSDPGKSFEAALLNNIARQYANGEIKLDEVSVQPPIATPSPRERKKGESSVSHKARMRREEKKKEALKQSPSTRDIKEVPAAQDVTPTKVKQTPSPTVKQTPSPVGESAMVKLARQKRSDRKSVR